MSLCIDKDLFKCSYIDMDHHLPQGRPNVYQRSATLNHNGSGQYSSNEPPIWHRQSSVDLPSQHQGMSLYIILIKRFRRFRKILLDFRRHVNIHRHFIELAPPLPSSAPPPTRMAQWNIPHDSGQSLQNIHIR